MQHTGLARLLVRLSEGEYKVLEVSAMADSFEYAEGATMEANFRSALWEEGEGIADHLNIEEPGVYEALVTMHFDWQAIEMEGSDSYQEFVYEVLEHKIRQLTAEEVETFFPVTEDGEHG